METKHTPGPWEALRNFIKAEQDMAEKNYDFFDQSVYSLERVLDEMGRLEREAKKAKGES